MTRTDGTKVDLDDADATPLLAAIATLDNDDDDDDDDDAQQQQSAVAAGAIAVVELLVASGASVNAVDVQGRSALHAAMELGHAPTRRRVMPVSCDSVTSIPLQHHIHREVLFRLLSNTQYSAVCADLHM